MKVRGKIWVEDEEGNKLIGSGVCELLSKVKSGGSLSEAAKGMNMSYNKAHSLVKVLEKRLSIKVLDKKRGGSSGGGSSLTDEGEDLIRRYRSTVEKLEKSMEEAYDIYFSDLEDK